MYLGSPVRELRRPNSSSSVPAQAVQVTLFSTAPVLRLTKRAGKPLGVSKAGSIRSVRSTACKQDDVFSQSGRC